MSEENFHHVTSCSTPSDESKTRRRGGRKSLFPCNSSSETSPLLKLTDGLLTLTTETNKLPQLILPGEGDCEMVGRGVQGDEGSQKKLSMDDGCCLESPAVSTNSSPSTLFNKNKRPGSSTRFNLMKRFDSDPTNSQSGTKANGQFMSRQRSEDKENHGGMRVISEGRRESSKGDGSSFKSPSSVPRSKRVAFSNETNIISTAHHYHYSSRQSSAYRDDLVSRQESVDDGFFDHDFKSISKSYTPNISHQAHNYTINNPETPSTKTDLPKNFERLLFSPVIECSENEVNTPQKATSKWISPSLKSIKTMHDIGGHETDKENFTFLKPQDANAYPRLFNSPVNSKPSLFKQPSPFFSLNSPLGALPTFSRPKPQEKSNALKSRSKFSCHRKLMRSESVNHDHNTSSSSDDSFIVEPNHIKRRKNSVEDTQVRKQLKKCQSMAALSIKSALKRDEQCPDLIGDFTREYSLPLINGRHQDLKCISIDTMAKLLGDSYNRLIMDFVIVDCRYPYEYEGGHIKGAINVHTYEDLLDRFFNPSTTTAANNHFLPDDKGGDTSLTSSDDDKENCGSDASMISIKNRKKIQERNQEKRSIIIFHCEFSSERGPHMSRSLRTKDRETSAYPKLIYPELYLLEGGYKAFFQLYPDLCNPQAYVQMYDPQYQEQFKYFKGRSSSISSKPCSKSMWS